MGGRALPALAACTVPGAPGRIDTCPVSHWAADPGCRRRLPVLSPAQYQDRAARSWSRPLSRPELSRPLPVRHFSRPGMVLLVVSSLLFTLRALAQHSIAYFGLGGTKVACGGQIPALPPLQKCICSPSHGPARGAVPRCLGPPPASLSPVPLPCPQHRDCCISLCKSARGSSRPHVLSGPRRCPPSDAVHGPYPL